VLSFLLRTSQVLRGFTVGNQKPNEAFPSLNPVSTGGEGGREESSSNRDALLKIKSRGGESFTVLVPESLTCSGV